jgi:hypothetical protein
MDARIPLTMAALVALAFPVASADPLDDPTGLSARCDFSTIGTPNSNDVLLALVGVASAPGAVGTGVACELLDASGATVLGLDWFLAGSAAAGEAHKDIRLQVLTVCTSAYAYYPDGSVVTSPRECGTP